MQTTKRARAALVGLVAVMAVVAASCVPPPPPAPIDWSFRATSMTVNDSQDEIRDPIFGACIAIPNCDDEPYLLNVAFRVRIGEPGSAQAWVVEGSTLPSTSEGSSRTLTGGQQAAVSFPGVQPLDLTSALTPGNKLDIVGIYTWAAEEDTIDSLGGGAETVADLFESTLNDLLAGDQLPSDPGALLDLLLGALFDDFGAVFDLILSNIPCFGLCDDVLGGAVYLGIGATGALAQAIDQAIASTPFPTFAIPGVTVPPDVQGGGFFTMGGTKSFTRQLSGADGRHTYSFQSGPA